MGAVVVAQGAQGELVSRLQRYLEGLGLLMGGIDGRYGLDTSLAVRSFQAQNALGVSGEADPVTWTGITGDGVPPIRDRALQVTAAFEGHGFGLAQGNFDGAGITWGIIGFTLRHGELGRIFEEAFAGDEILVRKAFGPETDTFRGVLHKSLPEQLAWADQVSLGKSRALLAEPWRSHFQAFGDEPAVQVIQIKHVTEDYFQPALETANRYGLASELGVSLCFDIHVQDGGVSPRAADAIKSKLDPAAPERDRRVLIAQSVAASALPAYRNDVASRKIALATGGGQVHGRSYTLRNWGLDDSLA